MPGKVAGEQILRGSGVVLRSAGGGGYGDPLTRPAEFVADDLLQGLISPEAASSLYGLVLASDGSVDTVATTAERARIQAARLYLRVVAEADGFRTGQVSRHRICRLHPSLGMAPEAIVELDTARAAPLRAWVVHDRTVAPDTVPLDARGQAILGVGVGGMVEVRLLNAVRT